MFKASVNALGVTFIVFFERESEFAGNIELKNVISGFLAVGISAEGI